MLQYTILLLWILLHYHLFVENESKLFYKQISPATLPSWKTISAVDKEASIESETSYIRQDESQTVVEREEVIEGSGYQKVCLQALQFMYFLSATIYHSFALDFIALSFICSE